MIKKLVFLFCIFSIFTNKVRAYEPTVLIINQVRGDEVCCQSGSMKLLSEAAKFQDLKDMPIGWAFRYDALENQQLVNMIPKKDEFGLLLEITPELAADSGVTYKGMSDGSDWYYAKNAFLVGYNQGERKKLIDTVFNLFKKQFGFYPAFTISWMIDSWSLNYIHDFYGVSLHELTKEQYETDSYTLYGGIFNAPYYPSKKHPLIPGYEDKLDLIIIRQTISDLIYNYGSAKAYFTSQPNDYLENPDKKSTEYFKELMNDSLNQNTHKFAVIGFENSYPWELYGNEYLNQLSFIKKLQEDGKIKIKKPKDFSDEFKKEQPVNYPFTLEKKFNSDSKIGVLWYFGKTYRARVIYNGEKLILDDLRTFTSISDPYTKNPVESDYAYWIIPYLIDGSSQFSLNNEKLNSFGIVLSEKKFKLIKSDDTVKIEIDGSKKGSVVFDPDFIKIDESLTPYFNIIGLNTLKSLFNSSVKKRIIFSKHLDLVIDSGESEVNLGYLNKTEQTNLFRFEDHSNYFKIVPIHSESDFENLNPIFQPDRSILPVDSAQSIYYWNNARAIAGRNPVRLFILPLNSIGRPTNVSDVKVIINDSSSTKTIYPQDYSYRITPWFIDIFSDKPLKTSVSVKVNGVTVIENKQIEFNTDCKKELRKCLTSGQMVIQYTLTILSEKKNQLLTRLQSL